jgi:hypothetical protein
MPLNLASNWCKEISMALLWLDGFDNYGTSVGSAPSPAWVITRKYGQVGYEDQRLWTAAGRFGQYGLQLYSDEAGYIMTPALTTNDTIIIGFGFKMSKEGAGYPIRLYDGPATMGVSVKLAGSELAVTPGTGTPYATTVNLGLLPLAWYYIELKVKCADSGGTYELKVNGATVLSGTGDTKLGSHTYHDRVCFFSADGAIPYIDDFYVCDASGAANNDFLGDVRVLTMRPTGAGGSTQWTPDSGSNYARVNEAICGDDTNYVEDTTSGHEDRYGFTDLSGVLSINGLMICTDCRETDAKSFSFKTVCQSDTTHDLDAGQMIGSTDYLTRYRIMETDPNISAAWTQTNLNAAEFGIQLV